ncbi:MAG: hypothetical protein AVDCRST_MAG01-01-5071, partial [uncultured Rubrobacteraceae bacterium]
CRVSMAVISTSSPSMSSTRSSSWSIPASAIRWYSWTVKRRRVTSCASVCTESPPTSRPIPQKYTRTTRRPP